MRQAYQSYDYERALNNLETPDVAGSEIDELLYLLDKGMILHSAGRFKESTQVLGKATSGGPNVSTNFPSSLLDIRGLGITCTVELRKLEKQLFCNRVQYQKQ